MAQLRQEELRALEQMRQRLFQLSSSIASLKQDFQRTTPLPEWDSLQTQSQILASNLASLTTHLQTFAPLLSRTVAYPSTNYPGRTQEHLLQTLLRKKAEPAVETWIEEGRALGHAETKNEAQGSSVAGAAGVGDSDKIEQLWKFAADSVGAMVAKTVLRTMRDPYTTAEREAGTENVKTGLRKSIVDRAGFGADEDNEEDDEDDEDNEEDAEEEGDDGEMQDGLDSTIEDNKKSKVPPPGAKSLDDIVRFMTTGRMPGET